MTGAGGPVPTTTRTDDQEGGAPLGVRRSRHSALRPVRGRWAAILSAAVVVIGAGLIDAAVPVSSAPPGPGPGDGVPVAPADAYSSSAFCSAGTGTAANSTIYLTNSTPNLVAGVMTSIGPAGSGGVVPTVHRRVAVPPFGTGAVNPSAGLPAGGNSSSFVFAGGGMAVSQIVSGPNGWSTAPCASQASPRWAFAGGSTADGNSLTLSLFNPGASEAAVNISFLTGSGLITPQAYQGLAVPAGQMVVENVGDFVQNAADIATLVTAQSGDLVSTEFQQWSSGPSAGVSLRLGAPALSTVWRFAQTTITPGSRVSFYLANPTADPIGATIGLGLSSGSVVPRHLVLGPLSISVFTASGTAGVPQQVPFSVTITSSAPIVAGRSVQAATGAPLPVWGSSSATATVADRWLVPAPGVAAAPGTANATIDSLAVANPGPDAAEVTVSFLGGSRPTAMVMVAPGRLAVLGSRQVGGLSVLSVSSSRPVYVEEDSRPAGAPGVVSSSGFPLAG